MSEVKHFYIADLQIDLSRSLIIKGGVKVQVEPKVLKVLLLLAQKQNEVVTHKEIMDSVWQGAEVVPNALQRCIAILRKELGDDAKSQRIIATHPRIGYSLLAQVHWPEQNQKEPNESLQPPSAPSIAKVKSSTTVRIGFTAFVIALFTAGGMYVASKRGTSESLSAYTHITPLTQTDAHETQAIYSPNGRYLIFNRYAGRCKSHFWSRDNNTGKERQLTSVPGFYGEVSFTSDGRELVFAAKQNCDNASPLNSLESQGCWSIATLDFARALSTPELPSHRYRCRAEQLSLPKAMANHQYAYLQRVEKKYQLMGYDDLSDVSFTLFTAESEYLYHFDFDNQSNRFAIFTRDSRFQHFLTMLDINGKPLVRNKIEALPTMSQYQHFVANFTPDGQGLLLLINGGVFHLTLDGKLHSIELPIANLITVEQHPTTRQLVAVTGNKDTDVAQLTLGAQQFEGSIGSKAEKPTDLGHQVLPYPSISRTRAEERRAQYQPNGEALAFISDRTGTDQIWLWHDDKDQSADQLSSEISGQPLHNFSWSPKGDKLAWVSNDQLAISDVQGNRQRLNVAKALHSVLTWYQDNALLVRLDETLPGSIYRLDIDSASLTPLDIQQAESAWVAEQTLLYSDLQGHVFTVGLAEPSASARLLPLLNGKAMVVKDSFIYSVNKHNNVLAKYSVSGEHISDLVTLKNTAWKLTDVKHDTFLISQFIAINQEVVVLE